MKIRVFWLAIAALTLGSPHASASDPVLIFGLPVGGTLPSPPKACPSSVNAIAERPLCWIEKPFRHGATTTGGVYLPNPESRPAWAAHATFDMTISGSNTLDVLAVRPASARDMTAIVASISERFGNPSHSTIYMRSGPASAKWSAPGINIDLLCDRVDFCLVEFRSARSWLDRERDLAASKKADAARPRTP